MSPDVSAKYTPLAIGPLNKPCTPIHHCRNSVDDRHAVLSPEVGALPAEDRAAILRYNRRALRVRRVRRRLLHHRGVVFCGHGAQLSARRTVVSGDIIHGCCVIVEMTRHIIVGLHISKAAFSLVSNMTPDT